MLNKKNTSFSSIKPYYTTGKLKQTSKVWIIFHGYGQLSEFFSKNFDELVSEELFFIFPQAPSKFYLGYGFDKVGASWFTKNDIEEEIQNNINYLNSIIEQENIDLTKNEINLLGFSQGVSILIRWLSIKKIKTNKIVLWAGQMPKNHINYKNSIPPKELFFLFGDQDPLKEHLNLEEEIQFIETNLKTKLNFIEYQGGHKLDKELIKKLVN